MRHATPFSRFRGDWLCFHKMKRTPEIHLPTVIKDIDYMQNIFYCLILLSIVSLWFSNI